jgi:hypothetical protein
VFRQSEDLRRDGMTDLASSLAKRTRLATGMTRRRAADLLFVFTGPESYRAFVLGCGWSPAAGCSGSATSSPENSSAAPEPHLQPAAVISG